jgi:hypothetical protein
MKSEPGILQTEELARLLAQAEILIRMYAQEASSEISSPSRQEEVQHEMKIIKKEILSGLMRSKSILQKMQKGLE